MPPVPSDNTQAYQWSLTIALLLLLAVAWFARWQMHPVAPLPNNTPNSVFSAERAYAVLETLLQEQMPHPVGSLANRIVEERILAQLKALKITTDVQQAEVCQSLGDADLGAYRCAQVRNIVARIPGSDGGAPILLSAHYDSVPAAPGASDAGAAVVTLLEVARLLTLQPTPRNGVVLLFNEGEEFGLLGAKAFMERHPWAKPLQLVLNVEARGSSGASILFETGDDSGWLVRHYVATTPAPFSSSLYDVLYKFLPNDTDLTLFKQHRLQGLNFAHAEKETHYHTPLDNLTTLDKGSLQHHGDNVWGVLSQITNADLNAAPPGNLVFGDVLGLFMLAWDEDSSLWLSLGFAALLIVLIWRTRVSVKGMMKALAPMLLVPIACGLAAWLILELTRWLGQTPEPWRTDSLPMRLSIWSAAALTGVWLAARLARLAKPIEHMLGQCLFWLVLSLISSVYLPGVSILAIVPTGIALLGISIALQQPRWRGSFFLASLIVLPLSGGVNLLPLALNLELLAGFHLAPLQGVVLGLTLCGLIPLLAAAGERRMEHQIACAVLVATLLLGGLWTSLQPAYSPDMPQHLNLRYVQDKDAHVLIDSPHEHVPPALAQALGPLKTGAVVPWLEQNSRYSKVEHAQLAPTQLNVIFDEPQQSGRAVTLKLHTPNQAADILTLLIPGDVGLERIAVHGTQLNYPATAHSGQHFYQCVGITCNELELTLHLSTQKPVRLQLIQSAHGLSESLQKLAKARGELAVERQNGDRSMVFSEVDI